MAEIGAVRLRGRDGYYVLDGIHSWLYLIFNIQDADGVAPGTALIKLVALPDRDEDTAVCLANEADAAYVRSVVALVKRSSCSLCKNM